MLYPPEPGTEDAKRAIAAFRATRCQFRYADFLGGICPEEATVPAEPGGEPRWCAAHAKGALRKAFNIGGARERKRARRGAGGGVS